MYMGYNFNIAIKKPATVLSTILWNMLFWGDIYGKDELPRGSSSKEPDCNAGAAGDVGSIPGLGRSPEGGHGNHLQYSCLEAPMDRGAWQATAHRVTQNQTQLKCLSIQHA